MCLDIFWMRTPMETASSSQPNGGVFGFDEVDGEDEVGEGGGEVSPR